MVKDNMLIEETIDVMDVNKLKQSIIDQVQRIEDVDRLKDLLEFIERVTDASGKTPVLTDEQERQLDEARAQIARGEYITEEKSNREIDEWLKED